jgi:hypothetical protein
VAHGSPMEAPAGPIGPAGPARHTDACRHAKRLRHEQCWQVWQVPLWYTQLHCKFWARPAIAGSACGQLNLALQDQPCVPLKPGGPVSPLGPATTQKRAHASRFRCACQQPEDQTLCLHEGAGRFTLVHPVALQAPGAGRHHSTRGQPHPAAQDKPCVPFTPSRPAGPVAHESMQIRDGLRDNMAWPVPQVPLASSWFKRLHYRLASKGRNNTHG